MGTTSRRIGALAASLIAAACGSGGEPSEAARLETRLDRSAVHFHVTLRSRLAGDDGASWARRLAAAASSREEATRIAEQVFERREEGAERLRDDERVTRPLAPLLVEGPSVDPHTDRAAYLLALASQWVDDEGRVPKQILVYEASRLDVARVSDPALRRLARAASALIFSRAGYCERVDREVAALRESELSLDDVRATVARWLPEQEVDAETLHADLRRAVAVLSGGAQSCCRIRGEREADAAANIARWIGDAEALGANDAEVAILRGFVALAQGDDAAAREQLGRVRQADQGTTSPQYPMLRDALASDDPNALRDATERLVDRRWLSALAIRATHRAFERDGLLAALGAQPEARALRRLAEGETAVLAAARDRYPMFDQAHQGDQSAFERLADLFR